MNSLEMEAKIKALESRLQTMEDINEIQILQRAYGYYLEHGMSQEVIDCFSDSPDVVLSLYEGTWLGKDGVKRYFSRGLGRTHSPELIHQVMQLSPIVRHGFTLSFWLHFPLPLQTSGNRQGDLRSSTECRCTVCTEYV